jgi:hypothetical protein
MITVHINVGWVFRWEGQNFSEVVAPEEEEVGWVTGFED